MFREVDLSLEEWQESGCPAPLVVEGVHGSGKTYTVRRYVSYNFSKWAYFNAADGGMPGLAGCTDAARLLTGLNDHMGRAIDRETAVVIDDVQGVPGMKEFLRSARESGFTRLICITSKVYQFEGAVRMWPMSFKEFMIAAGHQDIVDEISRDPFSSAVVERHEWLMDMFREFIAVGGLPGAVAAWLRDRDEKRVNEEIAKVIEGLRAEAEREAPDAYPYIHQIIHSLPGMLSGKNRKFILSKVAPGARTKTLVEAFKWLGIAGVVHRLPITNDVSGVDRDLDNSYKIYVFDTGVLRLLTDLPISMIVNEIRYDRSFIAGLVENKVYLEIRRQHNDDMFCWRSGNRAEIEFVFHNGRGYVPVQINDNNMKFTRSLDEFAKKTEPEAMVLISRKPPSVEGGFLNMASYEICGINRATLAHRAKDR